MKNFLLLLVLCFCSFYALAQSEETRLALLIGNQNYKGERALDNPEADVKLLQEALEQHNFSVTAKTNLNKRHMRNAFQDFWEAIKKAKENPAKKVVVFFYFSGHGIQHQGKNFLVPLEAHLPSAEFLGDNAINLTPNLQTLVNAGKADHYIFCIDACRNNPWVEAKSWSDSKDIAPLVGLAPPAPLQKTQAPKATLLTSFATEAGHIARDGQGNSPYAQALAAALQDKNDATKESRTFFARVAGRVEDATKTAQRPTLESVGRGEFYFLKGAPPPPVEEVEPFSVQQGENLKWGFRGKESKQIIVPAKYDMVSNLKYGVGMIAVRKGKDKLALGVIDKYGKVLQEPRKEIKYEFYSSKKELGTKLKEKNEVEVFISSDGNSVYYKEIYITGNKISTKLRKVTRGRGSSAN